MRYWDLELVFILGFRYCSLGFASTVCLTDNGVSLTIMRFAILQNHLDQWETKL